MELDALMYRDFHASHGPMKKAGIRDGPSQVLNFSRIETDEEN